MYICACMYIHAHHRCGFAWCTVQRVSTQSGDKHGREEIGQRQVSPLINSSLRIIEDLALRSYKVIALKVECSFSKLAKD